MHSIPVLVCGGGLAGLSAAMFLGLHGVSTLLVEQNATTARHPKARGQFAHTMEVLRIAGVADEIRSAAPAWRTRHHHVVVTDALVSAERREVLVGGSHDFSAISADDWGMASQERVEPILLRRARALGAEARFSTRLETFTQNDSGVVAVVQDLKTGERNTVSAQYLVAADGGRSPIRTAAGISCHGRGALATNITILFRAPLRHVLVHHAFVLVNQVLGPTATLVTTDNPDEYLLSVEVRRERGVSSRDYTPDRCIELIRVAAGIADLDVTLISTSRTTVAHRVADRFKLGRVLLIGDAARVVPPTGGLGGNTAIMDAFYLSWKLAAVVRGTAGSALLDSHDAERRPVSDLIAEQQYGQRMRRFHPEVAPDALPRDIDAARLMFGYRYANGAVIREPDDDGALLENPAEPTGRPGSRAPHVPLHRGHVRLSTTDLFGRSFVLLCGAEADEWETAGRELSRRSGVDIDVHRIGEPTTGGWSDENNRWCRAYGVTQRGAVLVRPDRFIAWRSSAAGDRRTLEEALRTVLRL